MDNAVLDYEETTLPTDDSDPDRIAHIILEGFGSDDGENFVSAKDLGLPGGSVVESMVYGTEITALCGMKLVAKIDPKGRPLCQACIAIAQEMGWQIPNY